MKNQIYSIITLFSLFFISCAKESNIDSPPVEGDAVSVKLDIRMFGLTEQEGTTQENLITTINILAFRVDENDPAKEYFDYRTRGTSIQDIGTGATKTFGAVVYKRDYKQRFVLIANASDKINSIDLAKDTPKEEMLRSLEFENISAWHSTLSEDFLPIPMWGETYQLTITDNNSIPTIKMLRMVSKIEVRLDSDDVAGVFRTSSLHLYNYHVNGRIVPDAQKWNPADYRVTDVTMPASDGGKIRGPLDYLADGTVLPAVYTFETPGTGFSRPSAATAVVVGGYYKDDTEPSYYRIDIYDTDDSGENTEYAPLYRNFMYRLNITSVGGTGYPTPDEAFDAVNADIEVEVIKWNEMNIADAVIDGQYMLGVSQGLFELSKDGSDDNTVIVTTNVPQGWKPSVDKIQYPWIDIEEWNFGGINSNDTLRFSVMDNDSGQTRTGYLDVTAGRLTYRIKLIQDDRATRFLTITDTEGEEIHDLYFHCGVGDAVITSRNYKVVWSPDDESCTVATSLIGDTHFDAGGGDNPLADNNLAGGLRIYLIDPAPMTSAELWEDGGDPFKEKKTRVTYILGDNDNALSKSITLRQVHYDVYADITQTFLMDGTDKTFTVKSNALWTAEIEENSQGLISQLKTTSGGYNTDGEMFKFTILDDSKASVLSATAKIKFTYYAENGDAFTKTYTIEGYSMPPTPPETVEGANSYILAPGGNGISIPVSWANTNNPQRIGASENLTAELLWTDHPNGIGMEVPVLSYGISGEGSSAVLTVYSGNAEGNAGIAVKSGDEIRWSWHIWVTEYDPDNGGATNTINNMVWMDRNIGALSDKTADNLCFGLFYQWGRKDPFPKKQSHSISSPVQIYKAKDETTFIKTEQVSHSPSLEYSVNNPMIFITGTSLNSYDWYGYASGTIRLDLWGDYNTKTNYDPCPPGWKIPWGPGQYDTNPFSFMTDNFWQSTYTGGQWTGGGFWPAAGRISGSTGDYMHGIDDEPNRHTGLYWGSYAEYTLSRSLQFYSGGYSFWITDHCAHGQQVRCVKQ